MKRFFFFARRRRLLSTVIEIKEGVVHNVISTLPELSLTFNNANDNNKGVEIGKKLIHFLHLSDYFLMFFISKLVTLKENL